MLHRTARSCLVALFAVSAGCLVGFSNPHDAEQTVTLKITGAADESERDEIQETLKTMTDGSGHWMSTTSSGDSMTVELAPVDDVEAFAERIAFGEVTAVNGRTVEVTVGEAQEE